MVRGTGWRQRLIRHRCASVVPAAVVILFLLWGCAPKVQVRYIPKEKQIPQMEQSMANRETILLLKRHYEKWRGTPYMNGGMSSSGMDCSGFTVLAYRDVFGQILPRTAGEQAESGHEVARNSLQPGDLVFFQTGIWQRHVGIYLADDQFIHASLSRGVTISSLDDSYWQKKFRQGRRLSNQQLSMNTTEGGKTYR